MGQSSTSNMQFPTEAWNSANQSANKMYLQGKEDIAQGISKGAEGITSYLKQQKQIKAGNDAAIKFMESPQGSAMLKLAPEQTKMFKEAVSNMGTDERAQYIHMFLQQALANQGQQWKREGYASEERKPFLNEAARVLGQGGVGGGPTPKTAGYGGGVVPPMPNEKAPFDYEWQLVPSSQDLNPRPR